MLCGILSEGIVAERRGDFSLLANRKNACL